MSTTRQSLKKKPKWDPGIVKAHKAYVAAINSNNTARVMAMYDKDAVVMQPDGPLVIGRGPIKKWIADYFKAFKTHWIKKSTLIWVAGDYGFDQGHDTAVDKPILSRNPLKYGKPIKQDVKGILIYKRQKDGSWLVYRDIWNSNLVPKSG